MKNRLLRCILAMLTVFSMAFCFSGCLKPKNNDSSSSGSIERTPDLAGSYGLYKYSKDGETLRDSELEDYGLSAEENFIEVIDEENIEFTLLGEEYETTYTVDDDKLLVDDGGTTLEFTIDDDMLIYEDEDGASLYFKKDYQASSDSDDDDSNSSGSSGNGSAGSSGSLGNNKSDDSLVGTYVLSKFSDGSRSLSGEDLESVLPTKENYIEIVDSTVIRFTLLGERMSTTYRTSGSNLIVKDGSQYLYFDIDGDTLSYSTEDGTLYFTKVTDEVSPDEDNPYLSA